MAILTVQDLSKYWGVSLLFKEINFLLNEGEKIALVGRNGTGKTTLLKILMGRMEHDSGSIILAGGARVGYLSQDPDFTAGNTLLDEALTVFAHVNKWERDLRSLEEQMGVVTDAAELQAIMDEYTRLTARFELAEGYDGPTKARMVLFGLGFTEADLGKPVEVLSGGQKVRLGLAKLLLEAPDLMFLDEPTNHLDIQATEWLEGYFKQLKSAAILVSHDRYFLDRVITRTIELDQHTISVYHGNYSYYLEEKERRLEAALDQYERQQREYKRLEAFYLKWRNTPSRKDQAQSRKKMLDRMELIDRPKTNQKSMKLNLQIDYESGNDVLKVEKLAMGFSDKPLFSDVNVQLYKGDRIALVGPNGAGKTTFLKLLQGTYKPWAGTIFWGVGVERGYFNQDLNDLDPTRTCMEEVLELPGFTKFDAYSLLGRFLFSGEDAHKVIGQCSGGERNRLSLAKLVVAGANLLLLDEPTNHLDLESKQVLEEALDEFRGTVIFVSHDRYFVDQVATKVWEFADGKVTQYDGNYSDYRTEQERLSTYAAAQVAQQAEAVVDAPSQPAAAAPTPAERRDEAARSRKEERKAAEALRRLEQEIQQLEARKAELEVQMAHPDVYRSASGRQVVADYNAAQSELERLYVEWEKALG